MKKAARSVPDPDPGAPPRRCLLDTNIFSYLVRGDTRAESYRAYLSGRQLGASFQTVAELRRWAIERRWGPARPRALERQLERVTIYLVDDALITAWAELTARLRLLGRPITDGDAWIAATAWIVQIPLVTHNRRHFTDITGLEIVSAVPPEP
ncbi:MAG TPA: PIN domain-containing protein [Thermomicrobiales bacterium]|nr:PIN domain-containing protein [Thermomicrobiales bacterium]